MPWTEIARLDEIPVDRPLARSVDGVDLALLRRGDTVVAVHDRCPHMDFPLHQGRLVDGRLECALHHWMFDVFDEPSPAVPPEVRCVHERVRVEGDRVLVHVDPA